MSTFSTYQNDPRTVNGSLSPPLLSPFIVSSESIGIAQLALEFYGLMQVSHPNTVRAPSTFEVALPSSLKGEADVPVSHPAFSFVWHAFENKKGSSRQYSPPVHYLYAERRNRFAFR